MYFPLQHPSREVVEADDDSDTVLPPWATVAIAIIIYGLLMILVGVVCHRYGCLGGRPATPETTQNATLPQTMEYRQTRTTLSPRREPQAASQPVNYTRRMSSSPRRKERPVSHVAGLTSSDTVNHAMLHPPPPAYTPLAPSRSPAAPVSAPMLEKGEGSQRVSRNTSKASTRFSVT